MRARSSRWMWIVAAVGGAVIARAGCGACQRGPALAPDQRLALHFTHLCGIASDGVEHPRDGVRRWLGYHGDHGPDMAAALTETLVVIERTADDAAHDARARLARDRLRAPLVACEQTFTEFVEAVSSDREASAALQRATTRLGRTIDILLGGAGGVTLDPRAWLGRVDAVLAGEVPGEQRGEPRAEAAGRSR